MTISKSHTSTDGVKCSGMADATITAIKLHSLTRHFLLSTLAEHQAMGSHPSFQCCLMFYARAVWLQSYTFEVSSWFQIRGQLLCSCRPEMQKRRCALEQHFSFQVPSHSERGMNNSRKDYRLGNTISSNSIDLACLAEATKNQEKLSFQVPRTHP